MAVTFQTSVYNSKCVDQELLESVSSVLKRIDDGIYKVSKMDASPCIGKIFTNNQHGTVVNGFCVDCSDCWNRFMTVPLGFVQKKYYANINGTKTPVDRTHCVFKDIVPDKNKILMPVFGTSSDYNIIKCMLENTFNNFNREMVHKYLELITSKDISITIWRSTIVKYLRYLSTLLDPTATYYVFSENALKNGFTISTVTLDQFSLLDVPLLKSFTHANTVDAELNGIIRPGSVYIKSVQTKDIIENSRLDKEKYSAVMDSHVAFFCVSETSVAPLIKNQDSKFNNKIVTEYQETVILSTCSVSHIDKHFITEGLRATGATVNMQFANKRTKLDNTF